MAKMKGRVWGEEPSSTVSSWKLRKRFRHEPKGHRTFRGRHISEGQHAVTHSFAASNMQQQPQRISQVFRVDARGEKSHAVPIQRISQMKRGGCHVARMDISASSWSSPECPAIFCLWGAAVVYNRSADCQFPINQLTGVAIRTRNAHNIVYGSRHLTRGNGK